MYRQSCATTRLKYSLSCRKSCRKKLNRRCVFGPCARCSVRFLCHAHPNKLFVSSRILVLTVCDLSLGWSSAIAWSRHTTKRKFARTTGQSDDMTMNWAIGQKINAVTIDDRMEVKREWGNSGCGCGSSTATETEFPASLLARELALNLADQGLAASKMGWFNQPRDFLTNLNLIGTSGFRD